MRTLFARMTICRLSRVMIAVFLAKSLRLTPFYGDEVRDFSKEKIQRVAWPPQVAF